MIYATNYKYMTTFSLMVVLKINSHSMELKIEFLWNSYGIPFPILIED